MCADQTPTLVLPSDRACPGCATRVLANRVQVLTNALAALTDAEIAAFTAAHREDQEAAEKAYAGVYEETGRAVDVLGDRTWIAAAFHAPSPLLN